MNFKIKNLRSNSLIKLYAALICSSFFPISICICMSLHTHIHTQTWDVIFECKKGLRARAPSREYNFTKCATIYPGELPTLRDNLETLEFHPLTLFTTFLTTPWSFSSSSTSRPSSRYRMYNTYICMCIEKFCNSKIRTWVGKTLETGMEFSSGYVECIYVCVCVTQELVQWNFAKFSIIKFSWIRFWLFQDVNNK